MAEVKPKVVGDSDKTEKQPQATVDLLKLEKNLLESVEWEEEELVRKAKQKFQVAADSRRRYDWEWLARDLFRRGYQFTKYNPQTKTVILSQVTNTKIPINLTAASIRSIRNQVVVFKPKWEVIPTNSDDDSVDNAKYSSKTLDIVFELLRLRKKIKEAVTQGLIFSVGGAWQIGWDKEYINTDGTKGFVFIWGGDPFDFYTDPNSTDGMAFTDAEYCIKAVRKPLDEVKKNPMYKNTEFLTTGEMRPAASEYKQFLLQSIKFQMGSRNLDDTKTVILKEGWFKERDKSGKVKMRVLHWVDLMTKPLYNAVVDTEDFPFRMYQADMNPNETYGEGWARHVIPINRVINALESSIFDYNYKFNRGRIVIDKNSGVSVIDNQHGTLIEKNRGADVHAMPIQPMSPSAESQILRMRNYFEDIAGTHDASLGRVPTGVKSGIGIAELKQADATNQDDLVDNLEDFLIEVGRKLLRTISENMNFPQLVAATNVAGKTDYFAIVGEKYAKNRKKKTIRIGEKEYPLVVIKPDNTIRVQIGSWLAYSKQQKQQELKDLFTSGVIDQRTLLEHLEFGDVDTIIARTRQESILKRRRDSQQVVSDEVTEEELAMTENQMLLLGDERITPLPQDDHRVHISVHSQYQDHELVQMHIQEHQAMQEAQKTQGPAELQVAPAEVPQVAPASMEAPVEMAPTEVAPVQMPPTAAEAMPV